MEISEIVSAEDLGARSSLGYRAIVDAVPVSVLVACQGADRGDSR